MSDKSFPKLRTDVIRDIIQLSKDKYVYPDKGVEIAAQIEAKLEAGEYDDVVDENKLAVRLTIDLQKVSNDHHWAVIFDPKGAADAVDPEAEEDEDRLASYIEMARKRNFGFERVERLKGNIGYIDQRFFYPSEYGGETAVAAMNFVANCDALIFDVRKNHGGFPSMVQLVISYLYDTEPRHINSFYYRPTDDTQQFWTFPYVPGKRRPDIPVYVLVSGETGSGPEEFAYDLKHMGRATLLGETTLGAAHPVTKEIVQAVFTLRLPYGRAINPVTGTNWEGIGVKPHIEVPAEDALRVAHLSALDLLLENCQSEDEKKSLAWTKEIVESEYNPVVLDESTLARYGGKFEKRIFTIEANNLVYGHQEMPVSYPLIAMSKTKFRLDEDLFFEFNLGKDGKANAVKVMYRDGRPEVISKLTG